MQRIMNADATTDDDAAGHLYRLWAKTNETEDDYAPERWMRHPLPLHLLDVGVVADAWLEADPLLLDRFCDLLPGADREDVRRVLVVAAALHDLGKVHRYFQAKSERGWAAGYATWTEASRPDGTGFDHGAATAAILERERKRLPRAYKPLRRLIFAVAGHHGTLYDKSVVTDHGAIPSLAFERALALALLDEIEHHLGPLPLLPVRPGNDFCMLAAGFVSVCDWLGSDSRYFTFAPDVASREDAAAYLADLGRRGVAETALRQAGLVGAFADTLPGFADFFGFDDLLPLQQAAASVPFGEAPGAEIAIVEEPMGGGKTEIAQYLTARALAHRTAAGLYFALPTQASANALFARTLRFTERVAGDAPVALVLAHGARHFFDAFQALLQRSKQVPMARTVREPNADEPAVPSEVVATRWLAPTRKALLAPIGLGTIDQALLGALSVRHAFVRLFGLGRKVVVFDEIHAYDAYMNTLILHLLRWLRVLGAKVILLSATLPDSLRRDLLDAYDVSEPLHDREQTPYPQVLHGRAGEVAERYEPAETDENDPESEPVTVDVVAAEDATAAGVQRVLELAERGGCVAWIRNTVREAQDAYRQVAARTDAEVVLLHARFTRADRNRIEEDLVARLGKREDPERPRPQRLVVIATQVIEQSVDLDFDAMVSDLAPGDLLLQRAGRLHRHDRPASVRHGHATPRLTVLVPTDAERAALRFGLSAYVYDPETLVRTAYLLDEAGHRTWTMPGVCRTLVTALYDQGDTYWTADRLGCESERLDAVRERAERLRARMAYAATGGRMPAPDAELLAMRDPRRDASDDGARILLTTRYGGHSATVTLFGRTGGRVQPVGRPAGLPAPDAGFLERLPVEEAFALSSVAFPWYDELPEPEPGTDLAPWAEWWRMHHRYDARLFALVDDGGAFALPEAGLHGRYNDCEGLVIDRIDRELPPDASGYADTPPYESL